MLKMIFFREIIFDFGNAEVKVKSLLLLVLLQNLKKDPTTPPSIKNYLLGFFFFSAEDWSSQLINRFFEHNFKVIHPEFIIIEADKCLKKKKY
jgi:hypothetical protein